MSPRIRFTLAIAALLFAFSPAIAVLAEESRPNLIVIQTDYSDPVNGNVVAGLFVRQVASHKLVPFFQR